ncbi:MAG: tetratricopeptide repeat protein, partial [Terriglobales bacterium]
FIALIDSTKRDYTDAISLQQQALSIDADVFGKDSEPVAHDLTPLAMWLEGNKQQTDAEANFKKAAQVMEKALGSDNTTAANSYVTLAQYYIRQRRLLDAEKPYEKAIEICEKAGRFGSCMEITQKLADLFAKEGKSKEIESLYQKEIAREEKSLGAESATLSTTITTVAELLIDQKRYAEAEPYLRRALSIQRKEMGEDHMITAQTTYELAICLSRQNKCQDAEPMFKTAASVFMHSRQKSVVPDILMDYAECLDRTGRKAEANAVRSQAKAIAAQLGNG